MRHRNANGDHLKKCSVCKKEKSMAEFAKDKTTKSGLATLCRQCKAARQRDWVKRNPKVALDTDMRCKYGVSSDDKHRLIQEQNNRCKGCGGEFSGPRDSCLDHCHKTGVVRGVLCRSCNTLLGRIEANASRHAALMQYIAMLEKA